MAENVDKLWQNAIAHHQAGRFAEAELLYCQVLKDRPEQATALNLLGTIACQSGKFEAGIAYIQSALKIDPNYRDACFNLGNALRECGRLEEAIAHLQKAISINPNSADSHKALGICMLLAGDLEQGFAEYEWRWQSCEFKDVNFLPTFSQPLWDGSNLDGKTILLYPEQGAGDQIQFIRYASLVKQWGGKVIYACHPAFARLFATFEGIDRLVMAGEIFPAFDIYAPLLSLPFILGTTLETIPDKVPYLFSSQTEKQELAKLESQTSCSFKVGLVWNSSVKTSLNRSCRLEYFLQLLDTPNADFFSLQKELSDAEAEVLNKRSYTICDLSARLGDFADTAAIIDRLDLVITVDTAVAHLAGAMGKPVWVLLPFAPDWRWMLKREDSPWYPTMCLFRQQYPGDWEGVIDQVLTALRSQFIQNKKLPISSIWQSGKESELDALNRLLSEVNAHQEAGRLAEAIASYQQILEIRPDLAAVYNNLGILYKDYGDLEAAIANYQKAIELKPDSAEVCNNLGLALGDRGDLEDLEVAMSYYHKAIELKPDFAEAYNNLGVACNKRDFLDAAIANYQKAIEIDPGWAKPYNNVGLVLYKQCKFDEAISNHLKAIKIEPNFVDAHYNLSEAYLGNGDFLQGFAKYEWRLRGANPVPLPQLQQPLWNGSDLQDRTILIYGEQGLGDQIQFVRYAALLQQMGGNVIFVCHPSLIRLFTTASGIDTLRSYRDLFPSFDVYAPLLSLPHILGTTLDTTPKQVPYLSVPGNIALPILPERSSPSPRLKVGLVWESRSNHPTSAKRSCSLENIWALLDISDIDFYCLQKETSDADKEILQARSPSLSDLSSFSDLSDYLGDFADTAAVIGQLDLVITIDTAVAHLAGAMGKLVWVIIPFAPDWRWMLAREDSPWYPTMRLFRQVYPGDWKGVIASVKMALRRL